MLRCWSHLLEYFFHLILFFSYKRRLITLFVFVTLMFREFLEKYSVKTIPQARLVDSKGEIVEAEARNRIQVRSHSLLFSFVAVPFPAYDHDFKWC